MNFGARRRGTMTGVDFGDGPDSTVITIRGDRDNQVGDVLTIEGRQWIVLTRLDEWTIIIEPLPWWRHFKRRIKTFLRAWCDLDDPA